MTDEKAEYKKCSRKDGTICAGLSNQSQVSNNAQKGLCVSMGLDGNSKVGQAKFTVLGVAYHQVAKGQGLLLNFCPWCGQDIQFWLPEGEGAVAS